MFGWALVIAGTGLLSTLLALRMQAEGFPAEVIGIVMSCYYAGQVVGARLIPQVVERVGHIRTFAAVSGLAAAAALTHVLLIFSLVWGMLRAATGVCIAGLAMVTESWLNERASNENRGRILALYMITTFLALGMAQFMLNLGEPTGFELFLLAGLIISIGLVPVALTRAVAPAIEEASHLGFKDLYAISPLGVAGVMAAGLVNSSFYAMGPIFAQGVGLDLTGVATFMGVTIIAGLILQWPVGRLSDRYDRRTVLTAVMFTVSAVSLAIAASTGFSHNVIFTLGAIYGGFSLTVYSLSIAHANDFIDPKDFMRAAGGFQLAYGIGACIGPFAASTLLGQIGPSGLFLFSAVINAAIGVFALHRMRQRAPVPNELQGPYVSVPSTSPVVPTLDPRSELEAEPTEPSPAAEAEEADPPVG